MRLILFATLLVCSPCMGGLTMTIDSYTTDSVTISISGTFDAQTIGAQPGWLAVKKSWETNQGVNTDWWSTTPTITANTIAFDGVAASTTTISNGASYGDDIAFRYVDPATTPIPAGTAVTGSFTLTQAGAFNPADANLLQLVSGYDPAGASSARYKRLEFKFSSSTVPEPSAFALLGLGSVAFGFVAARRRRRS